MTGSRRWPQAGMAGFLLLATFGASGAIAQVPATPPRIRPWVAGPVLLYPLFGLEFEHTDNLFSTSADPISTALGSASVGMLADLPFRRSHGRAGYVARFQEFDKIDLDRPVSHFFDLGSRLGFSGGAFFDFTAGLQDGAYDTRLFDPGGEIDFRADPFTQWNLEAEVGHEVPETRLLAFAVERGDLEFDRAEGDPGLFYDTSSTEARVRGEHRAATGSKMLWFLESARNDLSRPLETGPDERRNESWTASAGYRRGIDTRSLLEVVAGWTDGDYVRSTSRTAYSGLIGTFRYVRSAPGHPRLEVGGGRYVLPSAYLDEDYYVSNQVRVQFESAYEARIVLGGSAGYFRNDYPTGATRRSDDLLEGRAWVGYRFRSGIEWKVYAQHRIRESSEPSLDYDETRIGTSLRLGI